MREAGKVPSGLEWKLLDSRTAIALATSRPRHPGRVMQRIQKRRSPPSKGPIPPHERSLLLPGRGRGDSGPERPRLTEARGA